jgi:hypothetical protein
VFRKWPDYAGQAAVPAERIEEIGKHLHTKL